MHDFHEPKDEKTLKQNSQVVTILWTFMAISFAYNFSHDMTESFTNLI